MPDATTLYRGRFAPSPTGPLHLGSLIAALASYLDAHYHGGQWLVRMEDLDPPREEPGAAQRILDSLQAHGLQWQEEVLYQSTRGDAYHAALKQLQQHGALFRCRCTRAMVGPDGSCTGHCRDASQSPKPECATRIALAADTVVTFTDGLQGEQRFALGQTLSDFVLKRKDGLIAYQLAVAVDDAWQGITHVVRGSDLLESTPRQIYLQQTLGYNTPHYCHIPVITGPGGQKLSKQNHAEPLQDARALDNLRRALAFLGQTPAPEDARDTQALLRFAVDNWSLHRVPAKLAGQEGH